VLYCLGHLGRLAGLKPIDMECAVNVSPITLLLASMIFGSLDLAGAVSGSGTGLAQQLDVAAPAPAAGSRIRLGGNMMKKMLKKKIQPLYPQEARDQRLQGIVRLHIIVGTDGKVLQVEYVSGPTVFVQGSIDAVRQWEYKPTLLNSQPVEVDSTVDIVYSLRS
jgi:TonB family protein